MKNTDEITQLRIWRNDIVSWAQSVLYVQRPDTGKLGLLRLEEHQVQALREATETDEHGNFRYSTIVFSWPKREGKSLLSAIIVTWLTTCFTNKKSVVLANSERQAASVIYDEIVGFFRNSPKLQGYTSEEEIGVKKLTVSVFGNEVICLPCNYRTVQGFAVTGALAVDELHAVQDMRAYNYLSSQTEMRNVLEVISSQAGSPEQNNPVWRLYNARHETHIYFNYQQGHMAPWAIDLAHRAKATLTPLEYATLHENSWGGMGQKLFTPELIDIAAMPYDLPQTKTNWLDLRRSWAFDKCACDIGLGLDRAGVGADGDRTVLTAVARFASPDYPAPIYRIIGHEVFLTGAEVEILEIVRNWEAIYGRPSGILFEQYNCSDIVEKVRGAELIPPTNMRQRQIFNELHRIFWENRFGFPENCGWDYKNQTNGLLKSELLGFEYGMNSNGNIRYGTQKGHDDTIYSLAWAIEAVPGTIRTGLNQVPVQATGAYLANYA